MNKTSFIDYIKNILKVNKIQNETPYSQASRKLHIRLCSFTVTLQVTHMEQALLNLPEHLSSHWIFSGVRVARSLVFCVVVLHIVIFGNYIVCPSSIYGFWLHLLCLQNFSFLQWYREATTEKYNITHTWQTQNIYTNIYTCKYLHLMHCCDIFGIFKWISLKIVYTRQVWQPWRITSSKDNKLIVH